MSKELTDEQAAKEEQKKAIDFYKAIVKIRKKRARKIEKMIVKRLGIPKDMIITNMITTGLSRLETYEDEENDYELPKYPIDAEEQVYKQMKVYMAKIDGKTLFEHLHQLEKRIGSERIETVGEVMSGTVITPRTMLLLMSLLLMKKKD